MNKAHMLCQAYTAMIYRSRGLLYLALQCVQGENAWDALRTICSQIKEMTPALVNGDIAQNIRYMDDSRPREGKFPMVNATVFKYPNCDYLLLAVNIVPFAVDTKFKVGGMKNAVRLFDETDKEFAGEFFTDKIEGYGVRAYRIKLSDNPVPLQGRRFPLTTEWKRYQVAIVPPPPAGSTFWISGLQMEAGETATEFQDDSVIEKNK